MSKENVISRTAEYVESASACTGRVVDDYMSELKELKQVANVKEYYDSFIDVVNRLERPQEHSTKSKECLQTDTPTLSQPEELLNQELRMNGKLVLEKQVARESKEVIEGASRGFNVVSKNAYIGGYTGNVCASRVGEIAKQARIVKDIKDLELNDFK
ncbi:hypothetical protein Tco_0834028 [Tanacetum coccineum]